MIRGEVLKKLMQGLKNDIPFFMSIDDDMNMIPADVAITIWEKLSEDISVRREPEPEKLQERKDNIQKPKAKTGQKKSLDIGKIHALRRAGWSYAKIADEMGCAQ